MSRRSSSRTVPLDEIEHVEDVSSDEESGDEIIDKAPPARSPPAPSSGSRRGSRHGSRHGSRRGSRRMSRQVGAARTSGVLPAGIVAADVDASSAASSSSSSSSSAADAGGFKRHSSIAHTASSENAVVAFLRSVEPAILIGGAVAFVLAIVLLVVLLLPETPSCYLHDSNYYVKVIPNASINSVSPPLACLAQSNSSDFDVDARAILNYEGTLARFFLLVDEDAVSNATRAAVAVDVDTTKTPFTLSAPYASFLYVDEAAALAAGAIELEVVARECDDDFDIQHPIIRAPENENAFTVEAVERRPLRGRPASSLCRRLTITAPLVRLNASSLVPQLLVVQPTPTSLPDVVSSTRRESPAPACQHSSFARLVLVSPPRVDDVVPPYQCAATVETIAVRGGNVIELNNDTAARVYERADENATSSNSSSSSSSPLANVSDVSVSSCESLLVDDYSSVRLCDVAEFTLDGGVEDARLVPLALVNPEPAACSNEDDFAVAVVDAPTLQAATPSTTCIDVVERVIELTGRFYRLDGDVVGSVRVGDAAGGGVVVVAATTAAGCELVPTSTGRASHVLEACSSLNVTLAVATTPTTTPTTPVVTLVPPSLAACDTPVASALTIAPSPRVDAVALVCNAVGDYSLTVTGGNFLLDDETSEAPPRITIVSADDDAATSSPLLDAVDASNVTSCATALATGVRACTSLEYSPSSSSNDSTARVDASWSSINVSVTNAGAHGCSSRAPTLVQVPAVVVSPARICQGTAITLNLSNVPANATLRLDGVSDFVSPSLSAVDTSALAVGRHVLGVDSTDSCTLPGSFAVLPQPIATSVSPPRVCASTTNRLSIAGNFSSDEAAREYAVSVRSVTSGIYYPSLAAGGAATIVEEATNASVITVEFAANVVPEGTYDVRLSGGAGCEVVLPAAFEVDPRLVVFFSDPPIVYNGVSVALTIYATGLGKNNETADRVEIEAASTTNSSSTNSTTVYTFSGAQLSTGNGNFNEIVLSLPAGLDAGSYSIRVISVLQCEHVAANVLDVIDEASVTIASVAPAFAFSGDAASGVELTAASAVFSASTPPRVYVSALGNASTEAQLLRGVAVRADNRSLSAVLTQGLAPAEYRLIVTTHTGAVGVSTSTIRVLDAPVPSIDGVVPQLWDQGGNELIELSIADVSAVTDALTIDLQCAAGGSLTTPQPLTAVNDRLWTYTTSTTHFAGNVGETPCVVVVARTRDNVTTSFSTVSLRAASAKTIPGFISPYTLPTPARGACGVAARVTSTLRLLLVIGGDTRTDATFASSPLGAVQWTSIDAFGALAASFAEQRNSLVEPVSFAACFVHSSFVYVVGGHNGSAPSAAVQRALVLSPIDVPRVSLSVNVLERATDFTPGVYSYLVSAIFNESWTANPGGESLPSPALTVRVPDIASVVGSVVASTTNLTFGISLTLRWVAIDGASGYRVYRVPSANDAIDSVQLLAVVDGGDATSYEDDGSPTTPNASAPMTLGSLGRFHRVGDALGTARWGASAGVVEDRAFVVGGFTTATAPLAGTPSTSSATSYETASLVVTRTASATSVVDTWSASTTNALRGGLAGPLQVLNERTWSGAPANVSYFFTGGQLGGRLSDGGRTFLQSGLVDAATGALATCTGGARAADGWCASASANNWKVHGGAVYVMASKTSSQMVARGGGQGAFGAAADSSAGSQSVLGDYPDATDIGSLSNAAGDPHQQVYPAVIFENANYYLIGGVSATGTLSSRIQFGPL